MKIVFLTPLYFGDKSCIGGGERYPLNLARGILANGRPAVTVDIVSFGADDHTEWLEPGLRLRVLPDSARKGGLSGFSWQLVRVIAEADILHVHQPFTTSGEVGILAGKLHSKRICMSHHGGSNSAIGEKLDILALADAVVCQSEFCASLIHGAARAKVVVIPGGVDATSFTPPAQRPIRDRVLYVGRLLPHKGIDVLLRALPANLPLTICGRPYHSKYFTDLKRLAVGKRVEFVTNATDDDILNLYRRAWCTVLPSVYRDLYGAIYSAPELMGFTILEAMACGTPALCSDVAAMPEFVRSGRSGFIFRNEPELRSQLLQLAQNPTLVEAMGKEGRALVESEYDAAVVGKRILELYRALMPRLEAAAA